MRTHSVRSTFVLALILLAAGLPPQGCSRDSRSPEVPKELAGLPITRELQGEEAARLVTRMHGKAVVPKENIVAYYGRERIPNVVYLSRYPSEDGAKQALKRMAEKIGPGSYGFTHHGRFSVQSIPVHFVLGHGQIHFFFAKGKGLYWLAIDPTRAQEALADLLEVSSKKVPTPREFLRAYFEEKLRRQSAK